jgi:hypothetical protein
MPGVLASRDSIYVAKTVFVDGEKGYDALGAREDATKPFQTIPAGLAAMQDGDTLRVRPGTYSVAAVIDLPDLADIHIVHEPGVIVTSSDTRTYRRTSATALTRLVFEGGKIVNTNAAGYAILVNGAAVATPGYATGTGEIVIRDCEVSHASDTAINVTCAGTLYVEDVRAVGALVVREVGLATLRNFDGRRVSTFATRFDTGAALPDGFAGPGTLHVYSGKLGTVSLTGSLNATFDASCEAVDFGSARSAGDLTTGMMLVTDDLTISDTGTATRSDLNAIVGGDATFDAVTDFNGIIRGDLYLDAADSTVRGDIVGTVHEDGVGIATLYATSVLEAEIATIESEGLGRWTQIATGDYTHTAPSSSTLDVASSWADMAMWGRPIKWLSSASMYQSVIPLSQTEIAAFTPTGLAPAHSDDVGILIVDIVSDGDPMYHINFYSSMSKSAASLVAHTASFDDTLSAARNIVADNGSGLTGTITNNAGGLSATTLYIVTHFCAIVRGVSIAGATTTLTIAGAPLPTGANEIVALWIGDPSLVEQREYNYYSAWGGSLTTTLFYDCGQVAPQNRGPWSQIVEWNMATPAQGGTKVNLNNGTGLSTADGNNGLTMAVNNTWYTTGVAINNNAVMLPPDGDIDFEVTGTGASVGWSSNIVVVRM